MRALVTGGTGFIGSRLAERLAAGGYEVTAFGGERNPLEAARRQSLEAGGVRVVIGSIEDRPLLQELAAGTDLVFHLAAAQHETNVPDHYFYNINVEGTRRLAEVCAAAHVRRFVYGSTIGVYGSAAAAALHEESPPRPDNVYARTKLEAERVVRSFGDELPSTIIRIAETYGPGDGRLLKLFKVVNRGVFPMIGGGANEHQPVHVDDLVEGMLLAATCEAAAGQTVILAGAEILPTFRMVELVAEALGKPLRHWNLPLPPLLLAAIVCETSCRPFGMAPPWHRRRLDFFVKRLFFSQQKARRMLGYDPQRRFRDGAVETAAWYRQRGFL
jgi:nucleoside-diphosphate-sugar epimerase